MSRAPAVVLSTVSRPTISFFVHCFSVLIISYQKSVGLQVLKSYLLQNQLSKISLPRPSQDLPRPSQDVSMPLGIAFWIHFGRFWIPKSTQNRSRIGLKSEEAKKAKMLKNHWFFNVFCASEGSKINQKSTKNRFRKYLK